MKYSYIHLDINKGENITSSFFSSREELEKIADEMIGHDFYCAKSCEIDIEDGEYLDYEGVPDIEEYCRDGGVPDVLSEKYNNSFDDISDVIRFVYK